MLLDAELDVVDRAAVERHLSDCPRCRIELRKIEQLSRTMRSADFFKAPDALRARIGAQFAASPAVREQSRFGLGNRDARSRSTSPVGWVAHRLGGGSIGNWQPRPFGLAVSMAAAAIAFVVGLYLGTPSRDDQLLTQATLNFLRAGRTQHAVDLASADPNALASWLAQRANFRAPVRDLTADGFELQGARLDFMDERRVAVVAYRERERDVDVFVWPVAPGAEGLSTLQRSSEGLNVVRWSRNGMNFCAVSDLPAETLRRLRRLLSPDFA
jgi:anti-sigma factor RsiW